MLKQAIAHMFPAGKPELTGRAPSTAYASRPSRCRPSSPEADGTLAWSTHRRWSRSELARRGATGFGYTYADVSTAHFVCAHARADRGRRRPDARAGEIFGAMRAAVRNLGRDGVGAMAIAAVDMALLGPEGEAARAAARRSARRARGARSRGTGAAASPRTRPASSSSSSAAGGSEGIPRRQDEDRRREPAHDRARCAPRARGDRPGRRAVRRRQRRVPARERAGGGRPLGAATGSPGSRSRSPSDDLDGLGFVRARAPAGMEIAAGEYGYRAVPSTAMLARGAVDVLQADATRCAASPASSPPTALCEARARAAVGPLRAERPRAPRCAAATRRPPRVLPRSRRASSDARSTAPPSPSAALWARFARARASAWRSRPAPSAERFRVFDARARRGQPMTRRARPVEAPARDRRRRGALRRGARGLYAHDASNYRHVPIGVVIPRTAEDVVATSPPAASTAPRSSRAEAAPRWPARPATTAVVIDWSKYMNRIARGRSRRAASRGSSRASICDELVAARRSRFGLTYGPKPATHDRCCFGGMLANNCVRHARADGGQGASTTPRRWRSLLYDGTRMHRRLDRPTPSSPEPLARGRAAAPTVLRSSCALRDRYARAHPPRASRACRAACPATTSTSSCPATDGRFNVARALVGSEGTCVTMLETTVRLVDDCAPKRVVVMLGYPDVYRAADHVPEVLASSPTRWPRGHGRSASTTTYDRKHDPHEQLPRAPAGRARLALRRVRREPRADEARDNADDASRARCAELTVAAVDQLVTTTRRRSTSGTCASPASARRRSCPASPTPGRAGRTRRSRPSDSGPTCATCARSATATASTPSLYGHFGMGCVHCRIDFDLTSAAGSRPVPRFLRRGDGPRRVHLRRLALAASTATASRRPSSSHKMFGPELVARLRASSRRIWDPDWQDEPRQDRRPVPHRRGPPARRRATTPW